MIKIASLKSKNLSFYRTTHNFKKYGEVSTIDQFCEYYEWAKTNKTKIFLLGNGSNTLFVKKEVRTLVLKNNLPKETKILSKSQLEVSSSVLVIDILRYCYENALDSFYYLASVPATIGGALAMNAGLGKRDKLSIYDFVESVTFFDAADKSLKTLNKKEIVQGYRKTIFTGLTSKFILSARFEFSPKKMDGNPISDRRKWSKEFQDYSAYNCGSVFQESNYKIICKLKGLRIGNSSFSAKTPNWILNKSSSSMPILWLIKIAEVLHFLTFKKLIVELIKVE